MLVQIKMNFTWRKRINWKRLKESGSVQDCSVLQCTSLNFTQKYWQQEGSTTSTDTVREGCCGCRLNVTLGILLTINKYLIQNEGLTEIMTFYCKTQKSQTWATPVLTSKILQAHFSTQYAHKKKIMSNKSAGLLESKVYLFIWKASASRAWTGFTWFPEQHFQP